MEVAPDDEPDTQPDALRLKCPSCSDSAGIPQGFIEVESWEGTTYRKVRRSCDTCWGKKWLGREALERWRARSGREP